MHFYQDDDDDDVDEGDDLPFKMLGKLDWTKIKENETFAEFYGFSKFGSTIIFVMKLF